MLQGWYGFLLERWDALRGSYWFIPGVMTGVAAFAALGLVDVDRRIRPEWLETLPWLTPVSAPAARAVLSTITGSMMTVTGVVFSITIVALTLTSSQFGPRLLRTFFRDRGSQFALGAFLATFVFNLLVLRAVETTERIPQISTLVGVGLSIASLFVLIYFIHHAASSIQASSVIRAVAHEIDAQIPQLFPESIGRAPRPPETLDDVDAERLDRIDEDGEAVRASYEGYLRVLDEPQLLGLASERDLLVRVDVRPGGFVALGSVLARISPGAHASSEDREALASCFLLGDHRTPVQDVGFLIEQLVEMAVRALSTGVNDPTTAIACVHRLGGVMARVADREMPSGRRLDDAGRLRVVADPIRFDELVARCCDPIRRYGAADADVVRALLTALATAAERATAPERLALLEDHAREAHRAFVEASDGSKRDREAVDAALDRTLATLSDA